MTKRERVLQVNGIHSDGQDSVCRMDDFLFDNGFEPVHVRTIKVRWYQGRKDLIWRENLKRISFQHRDGDHLFAHSHGCLCGHDSMKGNLRFTNVVMVAGAMGNKVDLVEDMFNTLTVFHNPYDIALMAGNLRICHRWGNLGRTGYLGETVRAVHNVELKSKNFDKLGHGHYFYDPYLEQFEPELLTALTRTVVPIGNA